MREFITAYRGYRKKMEEFWAMARQIGFYSVVTNQGRKSRVKKPSDLFSLAVDDRTTGKKSKDVKPARVRRIGDH